MEAWFAHCLNYTKFSSFLPSSNISSFFSSASANWLWSAGLSPVSFVTSVCGTDCISWKRHRSWLPSTDWWYHSPGLLMTFLQLFSTWWKGRDRTSPCRTSRGSGLREEAQLYIAFLQLMSVRGESLKAAFHSCSLLSIWQQGCRCRISIHITQLASSMEYH